MLDSKKSYFTDTYESGNKYKDKLITDIKNIMFTNKRVHNVLTI